jgi:hypothetical protein
VRACGLLSNPAEHIFVFHQRFLAKAARHMENIELRGVGKRRIRHQPQPPEVANRFA